MSASTPVARRTPVSPLEQTHLLLSQPAVERDHPDFIALRVADWIFAASTGSRLMNELRFRRGLVYSVEMKPHDWPGGGPTTLALQTSPQFSQGTLLLVQSMFRDYLRDSPTQQELDDVKRQMRGRSALGSVSNTQILQRMVLINRYNLPLDLDFGSRQVQRLTVDRIKSALNAHYNADRWSVLTTGPTTAQQPLPLPVRQTSPSMCRVDAGFVTN